MDDGRPLWRSPNVVGALGALVVVVVGDAVLRSLGGTPSNFSLFLGRLHPLAVHLPIGIVLLVGAAEAATLSPRLRPRVDPAIALALPLLVLATVGAFILGHLLGRAGDFAPKALTVHRRLELVAAIGICLCPVVWAYQERAGTANARWGYRGLLGVTLSVLSIGAHFGGTLTRGESYLGRYAPGPLKFLLGGAEPPPAASASARPKATEPRLYTDVIQPILDARCTSCHGVEKVKGGLRLDSLAAIGKGGEDGPVIAVGDPKQSPLLSRVLLPKDDEDHMPPEDKPQLTPAEIAAVRFWIERGANDTLLVRDLLAPVDARAVLEKSLAGTPAEKSAPAPSAAPPADSSTPTAIAEPTPTPATPTPNASPHEDKASTSDAPSKPKSQDPAPSPAAHEPEPAPAPQTSSGASTATGVLAEHCEKCHGAEKQKGKLRVDSLDALLRGGKGGPAVVPGNPGGSSLIRALQLPLDDDKHMPPKKEPQLTPREVSILSSWIKNLNPARASTSPSSKEPSPTTASRSSSAPTSESPTPTSAPAPEPATATAPSSPAPASDSPAAPASTPSPDPPSPDLLAALPSRLALYPTQISPLLREHCDMCHTGKTPAGSFSIDSHESLLKGGDTGPAVTPGKPEASVLVMRISLPAGDSDRMPPDGSVELTADEITLVTAWIAKDGTANGEVELSQLPAGAVRAISAHPPARSSTDVAQAAPKSGGCGACAVGQPDRSTDFSAAAASALVFSLALGRRRTRRLTAAG